MSKKFISIIIPVFNSQSTIYLLVKNIIKELDENLNFEIILINDFSSDSSESECIRAFNDFSGKVKFYSLGKNVGEHRAVMAGLNYVSGDWAIESGLMRALSCCCPEHEQLMSAALMGLGQPSGAVKAAVGW